MIKKINQYLLENHSLIWNIRLVWMLVILTAMHLLSFLLGFFSFSSIVELHDDNLFEKYLFNGYVWIGILVSILIFILWFNQYFKQNAFKSLFPKSNWSLYKEFLFIILISFLTISQYLSFTKGLELRVSSIKSIEEVQKEKELIQQVTPFALQPNLAFYNNVYSNANRCMVVPLFDTLVDQDRLLQLFVSNKVSSRIWPDTIKIENYKNYRDSLGSDFYRLPEFETLLVENFPERENWSAPQNYKTFEKVINNHEQTDYLYTETAVEEIGYSSQDHVSYKNLNSLYNFCSYPWADFELNTKLVQKNYELLHEEKKEEIDQKLKEYLKLADFYSVSYRFKDKDWIDYVYNPPYYFVDYELSSISRYNSADQTTYKKDHISHSDLKTVIDNLDKSKSGVIPSFAYIFILYFTLGISLLIYTFRMTSTRVWVISLVGIFILQFIFYSLLFTFGSILFGFTENLGLILGLSFILIFNLLLFLGISRKKRKLITGVNLNWSLWTFPFLLPALVLLYESYLQSNWEYEQLMPANLAWLKDNWETVLYFNLFLILIYIFIMLPILKKWQSMAEE